ncbi:glycosyltransferase family 87 protein [Thermincola potens]|uniref:DUF2029 domain-containing protein n=1 Tax=Thermincola potens (strain JR) TaxID=635013 RepID=D5XF49_THEPJ|nr:glycosyltransferase family 87 protein [Thermincola potens]ADG82270.1 hypothetical protein TherJR_1413 [Thermincola potens JR]
MKKMGAKILLFLLCVLLGCVILFFGSKQEAVQWDFNTYYYAGKAWSEGFNPYNKDVLSVVSKGAAVFDYVYSPITLPVFSLIALMDFRQAFIFYLVLKIAAWVVLNRIWVNAFLGRDTNFLFYLFGLVAFNCSFLADLLAGNIAVFEQLLLWVAFFCYLQGWLMLFCLFIVVVSLFKITPLFFLVLLLFVPDRRKYLYLVGSLAGFALIMALSYAVQPWLFQGFLDNMQKLNNLAYERGLVNPAVLPLLKDIVRVWEQKLNIPIPGQVSWLLYFFFVSTVLYISRRSIVLLLKNEQIGNEQKGLVYIFLACFVFALIVPRFKNYSYIMLILPAYYVLKNIGQSVKVPFLFVITMVPSFSVTPLYSGLLSEYYVFFVACLYWFLYIRLITEKSPSWQNRHFLFKGLVNKATRKISDTYPNNG